MKAKKKAVKKPAVKSVKEIVVPENSFNLWAIANEIEDKAMKISQLKDTLALIAEHGVESSSGAMWLLVDLLESIDVDLMNISEDVMLEHCRTSVIVDAL